MPPVGFEPTIPTGERPQTCALDSTAIGIGHISTTDQNTERCSLTELFVRLQAIMSVPVSHLFENNFSKVLALNWHELNYSHIQPQINDKIRNKLADKQYYSMQVVTAH